MSTLNSPAGFELPPVPPELGIVLVQPERDDIARLEHELSVVADVLGVAEKPLLLPERGFSQTPLTRKQRLSLTALFDPIYSHRFMGMQDSVQSIPIHESGERMVDLAQAFDNAGVEATFTDEPISEYCGELAGKPKVFFVRETVAQQHVRVAKALGEIGVRLHIEDAFRPMGVQEGLFQKVIEMTIAAHPDFDAAAIIAQARSKVAVAPCFAGHKGGAATDISLINMSDGVRLDPGNEYLEMDAMVIMDFPYITFEQFRARQLFALSMGMVGLMAYPGEDWHVSSGDIGAALASEDPIAYPVKYGPIRDFDPRAGDIDPYNPADYYKQFAFSIKR
jgi:D-alanyl-D-alanine dipeptidase